MALLSLQIFLSIDWYIQIIYSVVLFILLLFKAYYYRYQFKWFGIELAILIGLQAFQFLRIFIGEKGNKLETAGITFLFVVMTLIALAVGVYFIGFQTYVLLIEAIVCIVSLFFNAIEFFMGCYAAIEFKSMEHSL